MCFIGFYLEELTIVREGDEKYLLNLGSIKHNTSSRSPMWESEGLVYLQQIQ